MIKNIVFDIGKVLKGWNPDLSSVFGEEDARIVEAAIWGSGYWTQMDLGIEEDEKLFDKMIAVAPDHEEQIRYILSHLSQISEKFEYSIPWITQLKERGYYVYFLSNYSRHLRSTVPETIGFLPLMDGGVFSCDVHLLKPDPAIYQLLCDKYHLDPSECLFIDDRQENVDAAIEFGMQAILFEEYNKTVEQMERLLEKEE